MAPFSTSEKGTPVNPVGPSNSDFNLGQSISLERRIFFVLASLALIYAFLAGFRTVGDLDTGWQMATGRWVVQHHRVPSVDVLSYTAPGAPWTYPVGAGVVLYLAYLAGGFTLLSWISAAATAGTVALLLRRGSSASAGIAIIAVPMIAQRTQPRADMFSVVFFAAFLSILWVYYQTGRAALWLLPVIMLVWVNFHFGFAAGLGLIAAYVGTEVLEIISGGERMPAAEQRLRGAWRWLVFTGLVTFVNAWGWGIYRTVLGRANTEQQRLILEWQGVRLNWPTALAAFSIGGYRSALFLLLAVAVVAAGIALLQRQWGAAIILLASSYAPFQHFRMGSIYACVVVIVAGPILTSALLRFGSRIRAPKRLRWVLAGATVLCFTLLAYARSADLVSNRFYFGGTPQLSTFGTGLSWWFPRRAAEFIERENLPGEIFNAYGAGGYDSWKLGPQRRVYIYGLETLFGSPLMKHNLRLLNTPPDSPVWETEVSRYGINTILLSYGDGMEYALKNFCTSNLWRPVYLDEVSVVFVRRSPETEGLIQRFPVNCATAPLPATTQFHSSAEEFAAWINAAGVFQVLGRNSEALSASEKAQKLFPENPLSHIMLAGAFAQLDRQSEAEKELLKAVAIAPSEYTWSALADFYQRQDRVIDAIAARRRAADLEADPSPMLMQLGNYALSVGDPEDALEAFDEAMRCASPDLKRGTGENSFLYKVATGRAEAWRRVGDIGQAAKFQGQAAQLAPNARRAWLNLAQLYELAGRSADAEQARAHAASLPNN
jgi:tetratricopeptide (TPR) repeat protein